ncbi:exported hypothetical protein [Streptomyces misionensis JCM 4497]
MRRQRRLPAGRRRMAGRTARTGGEPGHPHRGGRLVHPPLPGAAPGAGRTRRRGRPLDGHRGHRPRGRRDPRAQTPRLAPGQGLRRHHVDRGAPPLRPRRPRLLHLRRPQGAGAGPGRHGQLRRVRHGLPRRRRPAHARAVLHQPHRPPLRPGLRGARPADPRQPVRHRQTARADRNRRDRRRPAARAARHAAAAVHPPRLPGPVRAAGRGPADRHRAALRRLLVGVRPGQRRLSGRGPGRLQRRRRGALLRLGLPRRDPHRRRRHHPDRHLAGRPGLPGPGGHPPGRRGAGPHPAGHRPQPALPELRHALLRGRLRAQHHRQQPARRVRPVHPGVRAHLLRRLGDRPRRGARRGRPRRPAGPDRPLGLDVTGLRRSVPGRPGPARPRSPVRRPRGPRARPRTVRARRGRRRGVRRGRRRAAGRTALRGLAGGRSGDRPAGPRPPLPAGLRPLARRPPVRLRDHQAAGVVPAGRPDLPGGGRRPVLHRSAGPRGDHAVRRAGTARPGRTPRRGTAHRRHGPPPERTAGHPAPAAPAVPRGRRPDRVARAHQHQRQRRRPPHPQPRRRGTGVAHRDRAGRRRAARTPADRRVTPAPAPHPGECPWQPPSSETSERPGPCASCPPPTGNTGRTRAM